MRGILDIYNSWRDLIGCRRNYIRFVPKELETTFNYTMSGAGGSLLVEYIFDGKRRSIYRKHESSGTLTIEVDPGTVVCVYGRVAVFYAMVDSININNNYLTELGVAGSTQLKSLDLRRTKLTRLNLAMEGAQYMLEKLNLSGLKCMVLVPLHFYGAPNFHELWFNAYDYDTAFDLSLLLMSSHIAGTLHLVKDAPYNDFIEEFVPSWTIKYDAL